VPVRGRHAKQTLPQIEREYVETGKVLYVMRHLPLESIHPDAFRAASAAECAGDQGKYWQVHQPDYCSIMRSGRVLSGSTIQLMHDREVDILDA